MNKEINFNRRTLAKAIIASPLLGLYSESVLSNPVMDVDLRVAQHFWDVFQAFTNPTEAQRREIGFIPKHADNKCQRALRAIAKPIMAASTRQNITWRIGLVHNGQINAITPGGGVIFIFDKLVALCQTEAELASVIAHEVGHIEHRHAIRRLYAQKVFESHGINPHAKPSILKEYFDAGRYDVIADKIVYKSYKRLEEHQADSFIIHAFNKLGYPLHESYTFFENMMSVLGSGSPDLCIYSTHPLTKERVLRLKNLSKAYRKHRTKPDSEAFRYLKSVVGHIEV